MISSFSSPCPRAVADSVPWLNSTAPLPVVIWAMSVVTLIAAFTPAPDSAPPVTNVTTSTTLKLLSAASTISVSLVGTPTPSARTVADAPTVTNVVTLILVCAVAPAALTMPPVVPLIFWLVDPERGGFWRSL